jgi:hypothetical protein
MADNNPMTPGGSVPPKPAEAAKVQPKKETVRISLPPKPSSSPTIKLPTLPSGGPSAHAPSALSTPTGASTAPAPPRPPTATSPAPAAGAPSARPPTSTGSTVTRPAGAPSQTVPAPRPAASASNIRRLSPVDVGLSVAAAVVGLGAVVSMALLLNLK